MRGAWSVVLALVAALAWADIDNLQFLGHNDVNRNHEMDAEFVGDRVFIACGAGQGVECYDVSDPTNPARTWLSNGPACWRTQSFGDTMLFAFCRRDGVVLFDISSTGDPVRLGQYNPPGNREALEGGVLLANKLYCAAHQNGVYEIDVTNPTQPAKTGALSLAPSAAAWNVVARDSFLLVANGRFGLAVVGLEGGLHLAGVLELPGLANDIVLDGEVAAVALGADGLATVDVSDPRAPRLLDIEPTRGSAWGTGISGHVVAVGSWRVLEVFDISDPDSVVRVAWDNSSVWAHGADIRDDSLVAIADWRGMSVYRLGPDPGPDIDVEPELVDFGPVATSLETTVVVRNTGQAALTVTSTNRPSGISTEPASFSVLPGDSQLVRATASGSNQVSGNVVFNCNDPDESSRSLEVYKNNADFPQHGSIAPDFYLRGTDTRWHRLSEYRGKVVYLDFGASW